MRYPGDVEHAFACVMLKLYHSDRPWMEIAQLCQVIGDWLEDRSEPLMADSLRRGAFSLARPIRGGPWRFISFPNPPLGHDVEVGVSFFLNITPKRLRSFGDPPWQLYCSS